MAEVISLADAREERTPHQSGEAVCIACRHKWVAVAPVGTWLLECPGCSAMKGVYRWPVGPVDGDSLFVCNCGCEALTAYFHNGLFRLRCMSCAVDHTAAVFGD